MKLSNHQITSLLKDNFQQDIGRHLYSVLGTYQQLEAFESNSLSQMKLPDGVNFPSAINLNRFLLDRFQDNDLRALVRNEGKRPQTIKRKLNIEFDALLATLLEKNRFLAIKQIEILFAYELDLETIRARATNQNHILLLLPGEKRGDHVTLFAEASPRFHRTLPFQLIADNHLWELDNA